MNHVPWSKRKKRITALWDERLMKSLNIHANAYTHHNNHSSYELPRFWVLIDKDIIWDFPGQFLQPWPPGSGSPPTAASLRLPQIAYFNSREAFASIILDDYVNRPVAELFEPLENDQWELGDILRAADRRLGKKRLLEWAKTLHADNPAHKVLALRFADV